MSFVILKNSRLSSHQVLPLLSISILFLELRFAEWKTPSFQPPCIQPLGLPISLCFYVAVCMLSLDILISLQIILFNDLIYLIQLQILNIYVILFFYYKFYLNSFQINCVSFIVSLLSLFYYILISLSFYTNLFYTQTVIIPIIPITPIPMTLGVQSVSFANCYSSMRFLWLVISDYVLIQFTFLNLSNLDSLN